MAEAQIRVSLSDGARLPLDPATEVLLTVRPQFRSAHEFRGFLRGDSFRLGVSVPPDGSGFAILSSAKGYEDAGVSPVKVNENRIEAVHLMLLGRNATFQFARASWERLSARPSLLRFLMGFETDANQVGRRYADLLEFQPKSLACLLNITSALELLAVSNPSLGFRTPLDYLKAIEWDQGIRQDRFFALASGALLEDLRQVPANKLFEEEKKPHWFHPGATASYKQVEFGEGMFRSRFTTGSSTRALTKPLFGSSSIWITIGISCPTPCSKSFPTR